MKILPQGVWNYANKKVITLSTLFILIGQPIGSFATVKSNLSSEGTVSSSQFETNSCTDNPIEEKEESTNTENRPLGTENSLDEGSGANNPGIEFNEEEQTATSDSTNETTDAQQVINDPEVSVPNTVVNHDEKVDLLTPTLTGREFIELIGIEASEIAEEYGLYASVMIAQASLESGFGASKLSKPPYFNLFGIKGKFKESSITMATLEEKEGSFYSTSANFRSYSSYRESMEDYAKLLNAGITGNSTYYSGVWKANTSSYRDATKALTGKYATDSHYADKLNRIIEAYDLTRFDSIGFESKPVYQYRYYDVQDGDTLNDIVREENVTFEQLRQWNESLEDADEVKPGERLVIGKRKLKRKQLTGKISPFSQPLKESYVVTSEFGLRVGPLNRSTNTHFGIDLATQANTNVFASMVGVVEQVGYDASVGNYIIVKHQDNLYTSYFHLNESFVEIGDSVTTQMVIGLVGSTGDSIGAHLHFAISQKTWNDYLDPRLYLDFGH